MGSSCRLAEFNEGDFVVVVGDSVGNDGSTKRRMIIANVIAVGIQELFLRCHKTSVTFKRHVSSCYKIPHIEARKKILQAKLPTLGDLVLSYSGGRFTQEKKVIGILIELIDNPPGELDARILCGEETHVVGFKSLIVIEEK